MYLEAIFHRPLTGGQKEHPWKRDRFDLSFMPGDEELAYAIAKALKDSGHFKSVDLYRQEKVPVDLGE